MTEKYTIKDIAKLAGVSKGTVDRVLHKRGKVSQKALDKVNEVLNKIDYQPNLIARNLKNNKVYQVYVLMPDPKIDSYWLPCLQGICDAIEEFKPFSVSIQTFYFNPESTESFIEINATIINKSPDAVLLVPLFYKETLQVIKEYNASKILITTFNNQIKSESIQSFVGQNLVKSGRIAAKLLDAILTNKHFAIIHIDEVFENSVFIQDKEKGFRSYFSEIKNLDHKIVTCKLNHPNFDNSLISFLSDHPTISGVFVTTSKAYQVAEIIHKNYKNKIAIVGYDLLDENITYLKNRTIDFLIHQNPKRQAYLGIVSLAEYYIFNKEIPKMKLLPIDIINSENFTQYVV